MRPSAFSANTCLMVRIQQDDETLRTPYEYVDYDLSIFLAVLVFGFPFHHESVTQFVTLLQPCF